MWQNHVLHRPSHGLHPGVDPEIVAEGWQESGGSTPNRVQGKSAWWELGSKAPRKRNTFTYLRVNYAHNFAQECSENVKKSVGLLYLQIPLGGCIPMPQVLPLCPQPILAITMLMLHNIKELKLQQLSHHTTNKCKLLLSNDSLIVCTSVWNGTRNYENTVCISWGTVAQWS